LRGVSSSTRREREGLQGQKGGVIPISEFNWDGETYTPSAGGDFISEEDFNRLIYTDAVVLITDVREGESQYDKKEAPKAQWLVDFVTEKGDEYTKGMTKGNDERDGRIERIKATIEATEEPVESSPVKVGRRFDFGKPKGTFGG
jgi:hypothetical protein